MIWPFNRRRSTGPPPMALLPDLVLTEDELKECQDHWRAHFAASAEGQWVVKEVLKESFQRNVIATCLIGRAERFAILANGQPEYSVKACEAGAKACVAYPLSAYFYDFATILEQFGRQQEARALFAEFLRKPEAGPMPELDDIILAQRDIGAMVEHATVALGRLQEAPGPS